MWLLGWMGWDCSVAVWHFSFWLRTGPLQPTSNGMQRRVRMPQSRPRRRCRRAPPSARCCPERSRYRRPGTARPTRAPGRRRQSRRSGWSRGRGPGGGGSTAPGRAQSRRHRWRQVRHPAPRMRRKGAKGIPASEGAGRWMSRAPAKTQRGKADDSRASGRSRSRLRTPSSTIQCAVRISSITLHIHKLPTVPSTLNWSMSAFCPT